MGSGVDNDDCWLKCLVAGAGSCALLCVCVYVCMISERDIYFI